MKVRLGFGTTTQEVDIPDKNLIDILIPNEVVHTLSGEEEVRRSLSCPIGSQHLKKIIKPGEKIVIVTSDITRPMPTYVVMEPILEELYEAGAKKEDITLVFALGSHRCHTESERIKLVGEKVYNEILCIDGDINDCVHMGTTFHGTPVDIVRTVAEADRRICLGNIEYHYFAGYSGGAKAIMPGVSTRNAIQSNHSMMIDPLACAGNLVTNPLRKDIEEAADICGVDFILNVVLDSNKNIIKAVAGDVKKAHIEGCRFLDSLYQKNIDERADIVIVSNGGAPKDLNLYQTQKALDNSKHAIKDGGTIILVGSCIEGLGEKTFEEWLIEAKTPEELIVRIKSDFKLGGHKAAAIAMVMEHAEIYLVSQMEPNLVKSLFMEPYENVQSAFDAALRKKGEDSTVIVMPYGGSTFPVMKM